MTPDNIFYTYIYLDPRKFGVYEYGNYKFDAEPFYVGKGKDDRYLFYIHEAKSHSIKYVGNKHIYYKIKKILKVGLEPIILKNWREFIWTIRIRFRNMDDMGDWS